MVGFVETHVHEMLESSTLACRPKRCAPEVLSSLRAQLWHRTGRAAALYETDVLARTDLLRGRTPVCLLAGMLHVDGERGARDDSARPYPGDGK